MRKVVLGAVLVVALTGVGAAPSEAVHFYRGPGGGCTPADGSTTDDPGGVSGPVAATVMVMHNTFNDAATGLPTTTVNAGEAVKFTWTSAHCHSVDGTGFSSGFHYPTAAPESPAVAPGAFHYPVPDATPTLSYTRTFSTPGTYAISCVHHASIGMRGTIVVE